MTPNVNLSGNASVDLSTMGAGQLGDLADAIIQLSPDGAVMGPDGKPVKGGKKLDKDTIVSSLKDLQSKGIRLDAANMNRLLAGQPILTAPKSGSETIDYGKKLNEVVRETATNPFLNANPLATILILSLAMTAAMTEGKLKEAEFASKLIILLADLTKELVSNILETGKLKMIAHIAAAVSAGIKCGASGYAAGKGGAQYSSTTMGAEAVKSGADAGKSIVDAVTTMKEAILEAAKVIIEKMKTDAERQLNKSDESVKNFEQLINELLKNIDKIADAAAQAHGVI